MAAYANDVAPRDLAIQTAAYFVGSTLTHVAACVLNDIFDRDFDRQVGKLLGIARLPTFVNTL
jgi:4-hydroxybenzoate polyprenyltransferase